ERDAEERQTVLAQRALELLDVRRLAAGDVEGAELDLVEVEPRADLRQEIEQRHALWVRYLVRPLDAAGVAPGQAARAELFVHAPGRDGQAGVGHGWGAP